VADDREGALALSSQHSPLGKQIERFVDSAGCADHGAGVPHLGMRCRLCRAKPTSISGLKLQAEKAPLAQQQNVGHPGLRAHSLEDRAGNATATAAGGKVRPPRARLGAPGEVLNERELESALRLLAATGCAPQRFSIEFRGRFDYNFHRFDISARWRGCTRAGLFRCDQFGVCCSGRTSFLFTFATSINRSRTRSSASA
jgi:hypothetical protein